MMKIAAYINRFIFGEVSPLLCARGDLTKYGAACKEMVNFIPLLQGPVQRRGGTRFIAKANNGTNPVALIDFVYSATTTYIIEVGNRYMRFYYQGAPVLSGTTPYQITTPWTQADIFNDSGVCLLKWVQSGDVLYIVCPGQPPQKLSRYGHTNWTITALPGWTTTDVTRPNATAIALFRERLCLAAGQTIYMSQSGAFENFELTKKYIPIVEITAPGFTISLNVPAVGSIEFLSSGNIRLHVSYLVDEVDVVRISATSYNLVPKSGVDGISRFGVINDDAPTGWRITADGVTGTIRVGNFMASFDPNKSSIERDNSVDNGYIVRPSSDIIAADDPLELNVYSEQMDKIEWMVPSESLLVGTTGGEFTVGKTTTVDPLGPENVEVVPQTSFGSSPIQALRVGAVLLFVQRAGRRVREFAYDYAGDNYLAMDVTVAAEHITTGGLTCLVWQSEPMETLWAARPDGQMIGFTYSKDQDMTAWHRHQLGGDSKVKHLATVPAIHGGRDELWLSVQRVVNGSTVQTIERMEAGHTHGDGVTNAFYVDCGLTFTGTNLTTISGLSHLEGCEVAVLGDGAVQLNQVVTSGRITLQHPASVVQVGLPFESKLTTVNLEMDLQDGTIQARKKRFNKVYLRLIESGGGAIGPERGNLTSLENRRGSDIMDKAVPLFSGDREINWPGGWETNGNITVVQEYPLPFTLAALVVDVNVDGKN